MTDTRTASLAASEPVARRESPLTCGGCASTWTGQGRAHCSGCHSTFAGPSLFDRHRRGYRCLDPAIIDGMEFRSGMWAGPQMTEEQKARLYGGAA